MIRRDKHDAADGQYINGLSPADTPAYASVTFSNTSDMTWAASTTDVRALVEPSPQTSRIASTWYSATTFHVTTTDNNAHTVALYFLDWTIDDRAQTVTVQTPSGTVLDAPRAYSKFTGGVYAVYTICGSVDFVVTRAGSYNAVVSGVFLGTPGATTTTNYLVDTSGGLSQDVADTDVSGTLTALYVRNGDELIAVMRPGGTAGMWTTHFVHADGLRSVRAITDESGVVVDTRGYERLGRRTLRRGARRSRTGLRGNRSIRRRT
jgi:hypothetical protein